MLTVLVCLNSLLLVILTLAGGAAAWAHFGKPGKRRREYEDDARSSAGGGPGSSPPARGGGAPRKCYSNALQMLSDEQGEWYVNVVLEKELARLFKFYSMDDVESEEEDPEGDELSEGEDSDGEPADDETEAEADDEDAPGPALSESAAGCRPLAPKRARTGAVLPRVGAPRFTTLQLTPSRAPGTTRRPAAAQDTRRPGNQGRTGGAQAFRGEKTASKPKKRPPRNEPKQPPLVGPAASTSAALPPPEASSAPASAPIPAVSMEAPAPPAAAVPRPPRTEDWQRTLVATLNGSDAWIQATEDHARATGKPLEVLPPRQQRAS